LPEAYYYRGLLYARQQEWNKALADYKQARILNRELSIDKNLAEAYYNRGRLYHQQEQWEQTLADYKQAISLNGELSIEKEIAEAYYKRGHIYHQQQKLDLALADYSHAIKINPEYALAYGNRGILKSEMGDRKGAITDLEQAQQLFISQDNSSGAEFVADLLQKLR
jgi:tetratricopeptide (TPR) repeat protein